MNLSTTYMGLKLQSPIIVSSSGLTSTADKIKEIEANGAGAVVLKSLFEEQIRYEVGSMLTESSHPQAEAYLQTYVENNAVETYIKLVKDAKAAVSIPVIASVNCVSAEDWTKFAKDIEEAGADAIELNIYIIPTNIDAAYGSIEEKYVEILRAVKAVVSIPVSVKIGMQFTNLPKLVDMLVANGAAAVVLFNRFFAPDIDIDYMKFASSSVFSSEGDIRQSLRWIGILSDRIKKLELSASTGVHDGKAVVKQLLAGAQTVQVCSALYQKGIGHLKTMTEELSAWMEKHGHETIGSFRSDMSYSEIPNPSVYERAQFMKYFSSIE